MARPTVLTTMVYADANTPILIEMPPLGMSRTPEPHRHVRVEQPLRSVSEEPVKNGIHSISMSRSESLVKSSTSLASWASDVASASAGWFSSLKRTKRKKLEGRYPSGRILARSAWELSSGLVRNKEGLFIV